LRIHGCGPLKEQCHEFCSSNNFVNYENARMTVWTTTGNGKVNAKGMDEVDVKWGSHPEIWEEINWHGNGWGWAGVVGRLKLWRDNRIHPQ
jgi:hypothetical protein